MQVEISAKQIIKKLLFYSFKVKSTNYIRWSKYFQKINLNFKLFSSNNSFGNIFPGSRFLAVDIVDLFRNFLARCKTLDDNKS
jgi:hypothetical protein